MPEASSSIENTGPTQPTESPRLYKFFLERSEELVASYSDIGRKARTLCARTALAEALSLARARLRSGGVTRPSADPADAGHGIATLPDVVTEALELLSADQVLKRTQPEVVAELRSLVEPLTAAEYECTEIALSKVEGLLSHLRTTYISDALDTVRALVTNGQKDLLDVEAIAETLISDLRARGFSDQTLGGHISAAGAKPSWEEGIESLRVVWTAKEKKLRVFVAVTQGLENDLPSDGSLVRVDELPASGGKPPPASGPFLAFEISGVDPVTAASIARSRIEAILGAAAVFVPGAADLRSSVVLVKDGDGLVGVDTNPILNKEKRGSTPGQVRRVIQSAWRSTREPDGDPLFDAIRHQQRALHTPDPESRFMLLWLGIERLVLGSRDFSKLLSAVRRLVPASIAMAKLRRDIGAFVAALEHFGPPQEQTKQLLGFETGGTWHINRERVLEAMLSSEEDSRKITSLFYSSPLLTQWYFRIRRALHSETKGLGAAVAEYVDASRRRTEWHILRLYRTRNSVAHASLGPAWIFDLISHAHYYLTQLVAICVHHREREPYKAPVDILTNRAAHYETWIKLVESNYARALTVRALLRPTALF